MSSWKDDIIKAFNLIGGEGHYSDIYDAVEQIRPKEKLTKTWKASVRGTIERFSKDSKVYGGNEDLFFTVDGLGNGIWGYNDYISYGKTIDLTEDDSGFPEGKKKLRQHILRERNPKIIRLAKQKFLEINKKLFCEVCEFNFESKYGDIGIDFIEGHHSRPISEMKKDEKTKIEDIVMVCSNCHKMLHRKRPWLTKNELKRVLK
ncbi:HNH endonuclease [Dokdonia sp.]|uniref:HNH endonuclease n=1 Tax=Dokdonia sp. TaxID=2024995 RepID=UPI003266AB7D